MFQRSVIPGIPPPPVLSSHLFVYLSVGRPTCRLYSPGSQVLSTLSIYLTSQELKHTNQHVNLFSLEGEELGLGGGASEER